MEIDNLTPLGKLIVMRKNELGESWKDYAVRFGCSVRTLLRALRKTDIAPYRTGGWEHVLGITFEQKMALLREMYDVNADDAATSPKAIGENWLQAHGFEFTDDAPAEVSPHHRAWLWERAGVLVYALWLEEHEICRAVAYYYSKYDDTPTYSRAKHDKSVAKAVMHCMGAVSDMLHVRGRAEQNNVDASSLCVNQFIYDVTEEKK